MGAEDIVERLTANLEKMIETSMKIGGDFENGFSAGVSEALLQVRSAFALTRNSPEEVLISVSEYAKQRGTSTSYVRRLARNGKLETRQVGKLRLVVTRPSPTGFRPDMTVEELAEWLKNG